MKCNQNKIVQLIKTYQQQKGRRIPLTKGQPDASNGDGGPDDHAGGDEVLHPGSSLRDVSEGVGPLHVLMLRVEAHQLLAPHSQPQQPFGGRPNPQVGRDHVVDAENKGKSIS